MWRKVLSSPCFKKTQHYQGIPTLSFLGLNTLLKLYQNYPFPRFANKDIDILEKSKVVPTEYGYCIELGDNLTELFSQKNSGPAGGLELVLDALIDDYMDTIEAEGFQIFLRMPNETVMNIGYGFAAKPGEHLKVNLKTTTVTRLGSPQGSCVNKTSLFKPQKAFVSERECKLTNIIWYFLKDKQCGCWPWYVENR